MVIHISDIGENVTYNVLKGKLLTYGPVKCRMKLTETFAFAEFSDKESAQKCFDGMNNKEFMGKKIKMEFS